MELLRKGDKVVCIDDLYSERIRQFYEKVPIAGETYTIREVVAGVSITGEMVLAVYLEEFKNPRSETPPNPERGFNVNRFEKEEPETETALLTEDEEQKAPAAVEVPEPQDQPSTPPPQEQLQPEPETATESKE